MTVSVTGDRLTEVQRRREALAPVRLGGCSETCVPEEGCVQRLFGIDDQAYPWGRTQMNCPKTAMIAATFDESRFWNDGTFATVSYGGSAHRRPP